MGICLYRNYMGTWEYPASKVEKGYHPNIKLPQLFTLNESEKKLLKDVFLNCNTL